MMDEKLKAALANPRVTTVTCELTDDKRKQFIKMSTYIIDYLADNLETPFEAYTLLGFIIKGLEQEYGIMPIAHLSNKETKH